MILLEIFAWMMVVLAAFFAVYMLVLLLMTWCPDRYMNLTTNIVNSNVAFENAKETDLCIAFVLVDKDEDEIIKAIAESLYPSYVDNTKQASIRTLRSVYKNKWLFRIEGEAVAVNTAIAAIDEMCLQFNAKLQILKTVFTVTEPISLSPDAIPANNSI